MDFFETQCICVWKRENAVPLLALACVLTSELTLWSLRNDTRWNHFLFLNRFQIGLRDVCLQRGYFPSMLWHCRLGDRKDIRPVKKLGVGLLMVMIWLELCMRYSSGCHQSTSIIFSSTKSRIETFWYRQTQVHVEKWPLNRRERGMHINQSHRPYLLAASVVYCSLMFSGFLLSTEQRKISRFIVNYTISIMSEFVHHKLKIWAACNHIFYTFQYHVTVLHQWHQLH